MGHLEEVRSRRTFSSIGKTLRKSTFAIKMQGEGCNLISRSSLEWLGFRNFRNSSRTRNGISSSERE